MRRGARRHPDTNPGVRPVKRLELSDKSPKKRLIIVIVLVAVALASFAIAISTIMHQDSGWTQINPSAGADSSVYDLVFNYELGASGKSPAAEKRELDALYLEACYNAYTLFHAEREFEGVTNLAYINKRPGEELRVSDALYSAFSVIAEHESRLLFISPFYDEYRNIFLCEDDGTAAELDPRKNPEVAEYFESLAAFVGSDEHISLELLGDNKIRLSVSEEYSAFAAEHGIDRFIDLYWAKNAFVVDFIADILASRGYVYGYISSYDGFTRNLDPRDTYYAMNVLTNVDGLNYAAARHDYQGEHSIVSLRAFRMADTDQIYYTYKNGEVRHAYVDIKDGLCRAAEPSLVSYAKDKTCAEVLLPMIPAYIADELDTAALAEMAQNGIYSIRVDGTAVICNEENAIINPYTFENITFTKEKE